MTETTPDTRSTSQHRLSNWFFMKIAGKRLRAYSVVEHVGRRSGREYQTPVGAYPLGDGFVVAILYGSGSQWVRNAFANGGFTLRTKGRDYLLERPEIIPSSWALPRVSAPVAMDAQAPGDRGVRVGTSGHAGSPRRRSVGRAHESLASATEPVARPCFDGR
jgi:deazaflavin-dependent oxidoreductase (nitroreductase family)